MALTLIPAAAAQAKTFEVTTLKDPVGPGGTLSLAQAIDAANLDTSATAANPALITFSSKLSGSIDLTTALPGIEVPTDIRGPGAHKLTINAAALKSRGDPVFYDYNNGPTGALTISGLSIDNVVPDPSNDTSGAVSSDSGALTLEDDIFSHDGGRIGGGAVFAEGAGVVTISGCTFFHDGAPYSFTSGGAAWVVESAKLTISDSTFNNDSAAYNAGALFVVDTPTKISDSTFVGNSASRDAGAILLEQSASTIIGSTITGNSAHYTGSSTSTEGGYGGGVEVQQGTLSLENSIVAGNHASGNKSFPGSPAAGSVFADVYASDDGSGSTLTTSFSLIQQDTAKLPAHSLNSTDITGKAPDLNPLAFNGGPTETELPRKGSPVINAGKAFGLKTDQRGDKRTVDYPKVKNRKGGDGTDIGAVELQKPKKPKKR